MPDDEKYVNAPDGLFELIDGRAVDMVRAQTVQNRSPDTSNLYASRRVFERGARLPIPVGEGTEPTLSENDVVVVFVDDAPERGWEHDCRYLLFDRNGKWQRTISARMPPWESRVGERSAFRAIHQPVAFPVAKPFFRDFRLRNLRPSVSAGAGALHAILFSGSLERRHLNNLEFLYRILVAKFGDRLGMLRILTSSYYMGNHWPDDEYSTYPTMSRNVTGAGTKTNFQSAVYNIIKLIQPDDDLLLAVTGHGAQNMGITCRTADSSAADLAWVSPDELANWLTPDSPDQKLRHLAATMSQCFSGAFASTFLSCKYASSTSFAAACAADEESAVEEWFDPYARHWVGALGGHEWTGDPLQPPLSVTLKEIFEYAQARTASNIARIHPTFSETNGGGNEVLGK